MAISEADLSRIAASVDEDRLWRLHMELSLIHI